MKSKLIILFLLICFTSFGQVPNNEAFTLQNVVTELSGTGAVARVDKVTKNSTVGNCTVGCNGYSYQMTWNTNERVTVSDFVSTYDGSFGAVTLSDNGNGSMLFTANSPGTDFAAASITTGYGTAVNLIPNDAGNPTDLVDCFDDAVTGAFDSRYYPYYLVTGPFLASINTLLNFRNYNGTPKDGIPIPVATAATYVLYDRFTGNGNASVGGTAYYMDVSELSNFSTFITGYNNYEVGYLGGDVFYTTVAGLGANTNYYYRFRAGTPNGTSGNSNTISLTTAAYTSDYHDWRLGTILELSAMRNLLYIYSKGSFSPAIYWSSETTPGQPLYARGFSFVLNLQGNYLKVNTYKVRGVRSFISASWYNPGDTGQGGLVFNGVDNGDGTYTWYECTPVDLGAANWADAQTICNDL